MFTVKCAFKEGNKGIIKEIKLYCAHLKKINYL